MTFKFCDAVGPAGTDSDGSSNNGGNDCSILTTVNDAPESCGPNNQDEPGQPSVSIKED